MIWVLTYLKNKKGLLVIYPYTPANILGLKMFAFDICCIYSSVFRLDFIIDANTMNPDQTAPRGAGSSLICVHIVCNFKRRMAT